jgi:HAE1 family hydrophobic/amphiphilic exporter-1
VIERGAARDTEARETEALRETMQRYPAAQVKFGRPGDVQLLHAAGDRTARFRPGGASKPQAASWPDAERIGSHYADVKSTVEQGFPEIQIRVRPGARRGARPDHAPDRRSGGAQGARRSRDALQLPRPQDRRAGARAGLRSRLGRRYPPPDRQSGSGAGDAGSVAEVVSTTGPSEIHRVDQVRVAIVSANLRDMATWVRRPRSAAMVAENPLPPGVDCASAGRARSWRNRSNSLLFAFALAFSWSTW